MCGLAVSGRAAREAPAPIQDTGRCSASSTNVSFCGSVNGSLLREGSARRREWRRPAYSIGRTLASELMTSRASCGVGHPAGRTAKQPALREWNASRIRQRSSACVSTPSATTGHRCAWRRWRPLRSSRLAPVPIAVRDHLAIELHEVGPKAASPAEGSYTQTRYRRRPAAPADARL